MATTPNTSIHPIWETIATHRLIAIIRSETAEDAHWLAQQYIEAGLQCIELTWNTPEAPTVLSELAKNYPKVTWGAGTVTSKEDAESAIASGARYLVSPALYDSVITVAREHSEVISIPGIATPTEMARALEAGADALKIFPASPMGGPALIDALRGPFGNVPMVVTGGISLGEIPDYFESGVNAIGVGTALAGGRDTIRCRDGACVQATVKGFLQAVRPPALV